MKVVIVARLFGENLVWRAIIWAQCFLSFSTLLVERLITGPTADPGSRVNGVPRYSGSGLGGRYCFDKEREVHFGVGNVFLAFLHPPSTVHKALSSPPTASLIVEKEGEFRVDQLVKPFLPSILRRIVLPSRPDLLLSRQMSRGSSLFVRDPSSTPRFYIRWYKIFRTSIMKRI